MAIVATLLESDDHDPRGRIDFAGGAPSGLSWVSETHYAWARPSTAGQVESVKVDAVTGSTAPLFDAQQLRSAFAALHFVPFVLDFPLAEETLTRKSWTMHGIAKTRN